MKGKHFFILAIIAIVAMLLTDLADRVLPKKTEPSAIIYVDGKPGKKEIEGIKYIHFDENGRIVAIGTKDANIPWRGEIEIKF
jgi:hypothetical protein